MKIIMIIFGVAILGGCSLVSSQTNESEVQNSPCACLPYFGEQLMTEPTLEDWQAIMNDFTKA